MIVEVIEKDDKIIKVCPGCGNELDNTISLTMDEDALMAVCSKCGTHGELIKANRVGRNGRTYTPKALIQIMEKWNAKRKSTQT